MICAIVVIYCTVMVAINTYELYGASIHLVFNIVQKCWGCFLGGLSILVACDVCMEARWCFSFCLALIFFV